MEEKMKKARLFTLLTLVIMLALFVLVGCSKKEEQIASVSLKDHDPSTAIEMVVGEFDYSAYTLVVTYTSGSTEEIALAEEMIAETDLFKLYQIGDYDITLHYGEQEYTFKVSVKRAAFEDLTFPQNNVFTYDGKEHVVEVDGTIPANAVVTYLGGNSFVNAGTYDVTAIVSCEGYVTQTLTTTVEIKRAAYDMSGVKFEGKEVVYDGTEHSLAISGTLPEGVSSPIYTINEKITASATNVGEYTVKATFANNDPNYEPIPAMEAMLKITPAEYTVRGVDIVFKSDGNIISDNSKVYDGKTVTFDLNDYNKLSKKVSLSFSVSDKDGKVISLSNKSTNILNAGVYTVKVEFTLADAKNYKPIEPLVRTFEILKLDPPAVENVYFGSAQFTYDGEEHFIRIDGEPPKGVEVSYEYYLGETLVTDAGGNPRLAVVDAGRYTVKAIFTHNDPNCNQIPSISATLNIEKKKLDSSLLGLSPEIAVEYSGGPYTPELTTWKELNGSDFDILQYSAITYYKLDSTLNQYVEMGANERPTEVGFYQAQMTLTLLPAYESNYCFDNGVTRVTSLQYIEVQKKSVVPPSVTFTGNGTTVYTGEDQRIAYSLQNADMDFITVSTAYFQYGANGYAAMEAGVLPKNAGSYKLVVTVRIKDARNCVFSNGEESIVVSAGLVIEKKVINVNAIFGATPEYSYTGQDLRSKTYDDLDPDLKKHMIAAVTMTHQNYDGDWYETQSMSDIGYYRVQYSIMVADPANVVLLHGTNELSITYIFHTFRIVEASTV